MKFDDGGNPFAALGPKVAYTLLSPFPWQSGSFALQVGKIDALLWYYLLYRSVLSVRMMWKSDRALLLMFFAFLVPSTIAYATTMANIGLIVRQRIPIVMVGALLGMLSWRREPRASVNAPALAPAHAPTPAPAE